MFRNSYSSLWMIFIAFSLLSSLWAGMGTFGFTYAWKLGIFGVAGIVWIALLYMRYPPISWLLVVCAGAVAFCSAAIYRGFTVEEPDPANFADAALFNEAYIEDNIFYPDESEGVLLTYPQTGTYLNIYFPALETLEGQWSFVEGTAEVSGALNGTFRARPEENWMNEFEPGINSRNLPVEPYMYLSLPVTSRQNNEQIRVNASLKIRYWKSQQEQVEEILSRKLTLDVRDSEDYYAQFYDDIYDYAYPDMLAGTQTYAEALDSYMKVKRAVEDRPGWIFLAIGNALSIGFAGVLIFRGGVLEQPGSYMLPFGSQITFIRRSGQQQLGLEAFELSRVPDREFPPDLEGVFVGRVLAQSPAGRADIRTGDVILKMGETPVKSPQQVNRMVRQMRRGDILTVTVWRHEKEIEIPVRF